MFFSESARAKNALMKRKINQQNKKTNTSEKIEKKNLNKRRFKTKETKILISLAFVKNAIATFISS